MSLRVAFRPSSKELSTILLIARHRRIWKLHGEKIEKAFETVTSTIFIRGVTVRVQIKPQFEESELEYFGWSHSGSTGKIAVLLCYESGHILEEEILWQLIHELGHRLLGQHKLYINKQEVGISLEQDIYESHRVLFSFLSEVIESAFDKETSKAVIKRAELNYINQSKEAKAGPYLRSWNWAKGLSKKRRKEIIRLIFEHRVLILPES